jgi:hypothetical protein
MIAKDPGKRHFYISLVKSCFRLIAGGLFMLTMVPEAGIMLILAEVLGVAEEL